MKLNINIELKCRRGYDPEMRELFPSICLMSRLITLSWLGWFVEVERR